MGGTVKVLTIVALEREIHFEPALITLQMPGLQSLFAYKY
jgi:hypothetical protein